MLWTALFLLFMLPQDAAASDDAHDPLFADHAPLELTLTAPLRTLLRDRPDEEDLPATLSWTENGRQIQVDVGVRTRGNYRRQPRTCPFAPLRLNFRTSEVEGTVFAEQDKLKLVTHCKNRSGRLEQTQFREYLTYRMYNVLTDLSYRVRPLRITYVDNESDGDSMTAWAFVIEAADRFGDRTGLEEVNIPRTTVDALAPAYTNLTSVFQFMVGNTDYSPIAGAAGEDCCHNTHLYRGQDGLLYPVAYDFDFSGLVNAPYASPNPKFRLRNVRQRLYRGRCVNNEHMTVTLEHFQHHRDELYALIDDDERLNNSSRRSMSNYLNSFFRIADDPRAVQRDLIDDCGN